MEEAGGNMIFHPNSAWSETSQTSWYVSYLIPRRILADSTDVEITVPSEYHLMPGKMAHDLYGDSRLWWVFYITNMDRISDPLYDFVSGLLLTVPIPSRVTKVLVG